MGTALTALEEGRVELVGQFGQTFSFGGTSFKGVVETSTQGDEFKPMNKWNPTHKFRIGVDPTQTAFASGLPKSGEVVVHGSDNLLVAEVEHAPGHHVAYISIRKTR